MVNRIIERGRIKAEYLAINTDRRVLEACLVDRKILIGEPRFQGRGGAKPHVIMKEPAALVERLISPEGMTNFMQAHDGELFGVSFVAFLPPILLGVEVMARHLFVERATAEGASDKLHVSHMISPPFRVWPRETFLKGTVDVLGPKEVYDQAIPSTDTPSLRYREPFPSQPGPP
jgi:hypothetical protein